MWTESHWWNYNYFINCCSAWRVILFLRSLKEVWKRSTVTGTRSAVWWDHNYITSSVLVRYFMWKDVRTEPEQTFKECWSKIICFSLMFSFSLTDKQNINVERSGSTSQTSKTTSERASNQQNKRWLHSPLPLSLCTSLQAHWFNSASKFLPLFPTRGRHWGTADRTIYKLMTTSLMYSVCISK